MLLLTQVLLLSLHLVAVSCDSSIADQNLFELDLKLTMGDGLDTANDQFVFNGKKCCSCPTSTTSTTTTPIPYVPVVSFFPGGFSVDDIIADVQLYSPDGKCNRKLAPLPILLSDSAATYNNGKILVCGGATYTNGWAVTRSCFSYTISTNTWAPFLPALQYNHNRMPGLTYGNKFYVLGDGNQNEAFDFSLQKWVPWKQIPTSAGEGSCMALWRDSFIVFGGKANPSGVQIYNITADAWTTKAYMPQPRSYHGCIALPNNPDNFLIVGSWISDRKTVHIYNAKTDSWTTTGPSAFDRLGPGLVNMNGRIFAYGALSREVQCVEEYLPANGTWSRIKTPLLLPQRHFQPLVLPASLFAPHVEGGCTGI